MVNIGFSKFIPIKWTDQSLSFLVKWTLSKNAMKDKESNWFSGSIQWSIHPRPLTAQSQCFLTVWRIANFLHSHWWFLNAHQWTKCWSVNAKESETKLPTPLIYAVQRVRRVPPHCLGFKSDQTLQNLLQCFNRGICSETTVNAVYNLKGEKFIL